MGQALGDDGAALRGAARARAGAGCETELFERRVLHPEGRVEEPARREPPGRRRAWSASTRPRPRALLEKEGPKYQYGNGCLSDGVLGAWLAAVCGVGEVLDRGKVASHLRAVHRYNLKQDLSDARQPAAADLRLRRGGRPAALHLAQGRRAVAAVRLLERGLDRHRVPGGLAPDADGPGRGRARDRARLPRPLRRPRAQSVQRVRVRPLVRAGHVLVRAAAGPDRRALRRGREGALPRAAHPRATSARFLSTATGYGTVGVKAGKPFFEPAFGKLEIREIRYQA